MFALIDLMYIGLWNEPDMFWIVFWLILAMLLD